MNTFFRVCVYYCIAMFVFTLCFNLVTGLGAFQYSDDLGIQVDETDESLDYATLESTNMNYLWGLVTAGVAVGAVLGFIYRSMTPVGLSIFGSVFWASYISAFTIISSSQYIPSDFILIFSVVSVFLFIAAIVGLITGGG